MVRAQPVVETFYDPETGSLAYLVVDSETGACAIIDPVLEYDPSSATTATVMADAITDVVAAKRLRVQWILDTHPHADHFSAAVLLQERLGAPRAIGQHIVDVQALWKRIYHLGDELPADGRQWDRLLAAGERLPLGRLELEVRHHPGHTLASVTYIVGDAAFVHDTLLMPDFGTARCDFPGGSAAALWRSIQDILSLPATTRLFTGHDYRPGGRPMRCMATVAEQAAENVHLRGGVEEAAFVARREARDATLPMPQLILHALQVNIRGGRLPEAEANGVAYLKIPVNELARWQPAGAGPGSIQEPRFQGDVRAVDAKQELGYPASMPHKVARRT
jgi:glyoxylase-like metal-dependent hydrolase (beta-lactamase superfamily II)